MEDSVKLLSNFVLIHNIHSLNIYLKDEESIFQKGIPTILCLFSLVDNLPKVPFCCLSQIQLTVHWY